MRVRDNRRYLTCLAIGLLACGDDGRASNLAPVGTSGADAQSSQSQADGGRQVDATLADATTVGADAGAPKPPVDSGRETDAGAVDASSADAGLHATHAQDAGSCNDQSSVASAAVHAALDGADQSCTTDTDCAIAYLDTDCFHACSVAVSAAARQTLDTAVAEQNQTTCAGFEARGCFAAVPPCVPPGVPACIAGLCVEFQGYPSGNADAGARTAPLVLNHPASASTAQLAVGQRLELTLQTIGGGMYGDPQLSSAALLFAQSFLPKLQNPGGPTQIYVFQAVSSGQAEITIAHTTRPEPFKLTVTIH